MTLQIQISLSCGLMMRNLLLSCLLLSCLLFSPPLLAADLDKGIRAYDAGNYAAAFAEVRPLAEHGDAVEQVYLAMMYYNGKGTSQNYDAAIKWYHLAAKQGYAKAQYNLGVMYYTGQGVPQDYVRAYVWSNLARRQGVKKVDALVKAIERKMLNHQINEAFIMALQCIALDFKDCDQW